MHLEDCDLGGVDLFAAGIAHSWHGVGERDVQPAAIHHADQSLMMCWYSMHSTHSPLLGTERLQLAHARQPMPNISIRAYAKESNAGHETLFERQVWECSSRQLTGR